MIKIDPKDWEKIHKQLSLEYPPSVLLIRYKMRDTLGFTVREHHEWKVEGSVNGAEFGRYKISICLDFYNDMLESWFRLKYL